MRRRLTASRNVTYRHSGRQHNARVILAANQIKASEASNRQIARQVQRSFRERPYAGARLTHCARTTVRSATAMYATLFHDLRTALAVAWLCRSQATALPKNRMAEPIVACRRLRRGGP